MTVTLTRITDNPLLAIEEAAANCYDSEPSEDGRIAKSCYNSGHLSPFEFAQFTFHIDGVSRALLAQLTRHRHAGYAVRSQRYCVEEGFDYYTPESILKNPKALEAYNNTMATLDATYTYLHEECGVSAEDARMVLPNACETHLEFTCNGRELIHIMNERLCTRAQKEIRTLCLLMKEAVMNHNEEAKIFATSYCKPKCAANGFCKEHKCCGAYPRLKDILKIYQEHKNQETNQE